MMPKSSRATALALLLMTWPLMAPRAGDDPPRTGPESEKRFPPLKVPPGFKATLFACDPMVEYPSAVAAGPRAGAVFVAVDYVSGLGAEIVRRDEVRLVEDIDGDGYADKASVYASGFNSIQGLAFHDGTLFVMHAPFLSAVRDANGDGVAELRHDLLTGLGRPTGIAIGRGGARPGIAAMWSAASGAARSWGPGWSAWEVASLRSSKSSSQSAATTTRTDSSRPTSSSSATAP